MRQIDGDAQSMEKCIKTHRCKLSVKAHSSIRKVKKEWILAREDFDFEWLHWYLRDFGPIRYCPYCGKELEDSNDEE